jgi:ATPase family associated with various cellular activities (AAA)
VQPILVNVYTKRYFSLHILGTLWFSGKTLVARRIAELCGLDYAVMSGGDLAPLGQSAVSELHRLLGWARTCKRGMLLVIDEAEACASDR